MAYLNPEDAYTHLRDSTLAAVREGFPVTGRTKSLHLDSLRVDDHIHHDDISAQHKAKLEGTSFAVPVHATFSLRGPDGEVLDKQEARIAEIPKITRRYSYIVDGEEYQVDNQWQLKPGVYARRKKNGDLEAQFNVGGRSSFNMILDPKTKLFHLEYKKASAIPAYPLMKLLGVTDDILQQSWGKDILEANKAIRRGGTAAEQFYKTSTGKQAASKEDAEEYFKRVMGLSKLRPEVTQVTLGRPFEHVTGETMSLAAKKLLDVQSGTPEDDRDSLTFKSLRSVGDFVGDQLRNSARTVALKVQRQLNSEKAKKVRDVVRFDVLNTPIRYVFKKSAVSNPAKQVNPLEMVSSAMQTTIMGPGGISQERAITEEAKMIDPSHLGFLDPICTPEGSRTGVTLRLPMGIIKDGNEATVPVYDLRAKKSVYLTPTQFFASKVVLPDQVTFKNGVPTPIHPEVKLVGVGNKIEVGKFSDADYVFRHQSQLFNLTSNLIPFLGNNSGGRAGMATRHMEQAVSLLHREAPLVQVATPVQKPGMETFEKLLGSQTSHHSPVTGTVTAISGENIKVRDKEGKEHVVHIYNNYPVNDAKSVLHSTPVVSVGSKVAQGQLLADTNYSKNGTLSLGTNARIAYLAYHGHNFEDGIVISDSAAKRLSSEHLYKHSLEKDEQFIHDPRLYREKHSGNFTQDQYKLLGSDGIVQVGAKVKPGDPLILASQPYQIKDRTGIAAIRKSLTGQYVDRTVRWDSHVPGEVVGVHKEGPYIKVHVRTVEPMQVGDKISSRYGAKGICTLILPDAEMPHDKSGKPVEVLLSPPSVGGRMNVGQILETAATKIAQKTGKPYVVQNFDPSVHNYLAQVKKDLKAHGLSDTEDLYDPVTKQPLGKVLVGPQYMMKLVHQVDKKLSVRSGMGLPGMPSTEAIDSLLLQPSSGGKSGGQSIGQLGMYSLLAHGAVHNIREGQTWKSEVQDPQTNEMKRWPPKGTPDHLEVWKAIQTGTNLPPPQPTFAFHRFTQMLQGVGINVEKKGHEIALGPMTDKQILHMSAGELKNPSRAVRAKLDKSGEYVPISGGLFDVPITGGHGGTAWSHITLAEPMPNPVFEPAIKRLLGLTQKQFESIVEGQQAIHPATGKPADLSTGVTGGKAIKLLLDRIDVEKDLSAAKKRLTNAPPADVDKALKQVKQLGALHKLGLKPSEAYVLHNLPILPPVIRPLSVLQSGALRYEDLNGLYMQFAQVNDKLKDPVLSANLTPKQKIDLRTKLYDGARALMATTAIDKDAKQVGLLDQIHGTQPKAGMFQDKLLKRRQDLTMRAVIVPEPSLALDELGVPRQAALTLFRPFLVRQLVLQGSAPNTLAAQELLAAHHKGHPDPMVWSALDQVMRERPVLFKRDPALHKYSVQGFQPKAVDGDALKIHPLVTGGFNADFDGDSCLGHLTVVLGPARLEATPHIGSMYQAAIIDISAFPRVEESAVTKTSGTTEYMVPPDVYVPAYHAGKMCMKPVTHFSIHPDCEEWRVTTRNGREVICSSDHSLAVLNPKTLVVEKTAPRNALDRCIPVLRNLAEPDLHDTLPGAAARSVRVHSMLANVPLTHEVEWFIGASTGDGWVTTENHVTSGRLPEKFLEYPTEFRQGLFCGLVDTDGSVHWQNGKEKPQFALTFSTISAALADGIQLLGLSLGLPASRTTYQHNDKPAYIITFSSRLIQDARWIRLKHVGKKQALEQFWASESIEFGGNDFVPMTEQARTELLVHLRDLGAALKPPKRNNRAFAQYVVLQRGDPTITRVSVGRLLDLVQGRLLSGYLKQWFALATDQTVGWDLVQAAMATGETKTMYDITVPDAWTFTMSNGLVVWDTMSVFVPISPEAVREARQMFPTNNLFNEGTGKVMYQPTLESALGVYKLSRTGKSTGHVFTTHAEAAEALRQGKVHYTDVVKIGGLSTTPGRSLLANILPEPMRHSVLTDLDHPIDRKALDSMLVRLGKEHRHEYGRVVNSIKDIGYDATFGVIKTDLVKDKYIPIGAHSYSLDDFTPDLTTKNDAMSAAHVKASRIAAGLKSKDRDRQVVDAYLEASVAMDKAHREKTSKDPSNLLLMTMAGIKPSWDQYKQMILAPVVMRDSKNRYVPTPVTRGYSEGMDLGDYWTQLHGARRGAVRKVQEVEKPGALTKLLMNSSMSLLVDGHDCGTKNGVLLHVDEPDLHDRHLASDFSVGNLHIPAGTLLTPDVVGKIRQVDKNANVVARSPLKCAHDRGICQKCMGLSVTGQPHTLGTNVGVIAAQTVGERSVQLMLKEFHCMHEHSMVLVRQNNRVYHTTLGHIFGALPVGTVGAEEVRVPQALEVWDRGGWTLVLSAHRHVQHPATTMVFTRSRAGYGIVSQDNHPHMLADNLAVCSACGRYPKKSGKQYYCRACGTNLGLSTFTPAEQYEMVEPQQLTKKSHTALLDCGPTPSSSNDTPLVDGWLAGIYCAEGWIQAQRRKDGEHIVGFGIGQKQGSPIFEKVGAALRLEFGTEKIVFGPKGYVAYNTERGEHFQKAFGRYSRNVGLPDGWSGYPTSWLGNFVAGVFDGDGTLLNCTDSAWLVGRIDTTSFLLAQQVHWALRSASINARIITTPWRKASLHQGFAVRFVVTESARKWLSASVKLAGASGKPIVQEERFAGVVDYIRPICFGAPPYVYDLKTESGTLYVDGFWTHNTGGIAEVGRSGGNAFARFEQLTKLPEKIPNAATLAAHTGKVERVTNSPTGAHVWIGGKEHFVGKDENGLPLYEHLPHATKSAGYLPWKAPEVGVHFEVGQSLSDPNRTVVNPHDLYAATKSMDRVQDYLTSGIHDLYKGEGVRRRGIEVMVRAMSNLTKISDPGDHPYVLRGEFYPTTQVQRINETELKGKRPIVHTPVLKGADMLPLSLTEDWMAKMNHQRLKGTLMEAAALGLVSQLHGPHPTPGLAYGAEFGRAKPSPAGPGMKPAVLPFHY